MINPRDAFGVQIATWVEETKERMRQVLVESVGLFVEEMQRPVAEGGNMPIDTGFLRSSLRASVDTALPMNRPNPGGSSYSYDPERVMSVVRTVRPGQKLFLTYGAEYAAHQNYGTTTMAGRHFVDLAAQRWPRIVEAAVNRAAGVRRGDK